MAAVNPATTTGPLGARGGRRVPGWPVAAKKMAPTNARVPYKNGHEQLTDLDLQPLHDPEVRFTVGHRHFAAPNPVHVGRQFINDVSFKNVIDS